MTGPNKKILFLTGTRADFGKLKPLMVEVKNTPGFAYQIFVTGMHMLSRYGLTINEIRKAGLSQTYPYINQDGGVNFQMDLVLANTIQGFGHYVREFQPHLIVVHGDRVETLAGAVVGALNNILVAHIEGGEVSGTIDELIRHAVTKLSHLHFVANGEARDRLLQMGERPEAIFVIGSPDIDIMLSAGLPRLDDVRRKYQIPFQEYAIFIYHPVTTELHLLPRHLEEILQAVLDSQLNFVVFYPNNDAGSDVILDRLGRLSGHRRLRLIPSMRFEYFLTLLRHAQAIVGNSSAGIREAPVYGVPAVNIGSRQMNRFHHASIINVPNRKEDILQTLGRLPETLKPNHHFGRGDSARRFMEILGTAAFWENSPQKQFCDLPLPHLANGPGREP